MFKNIVLAVVVLIALVMVYAATRPDSFRLERTISIQAPPDRVFALINDFHRWATWSPWEKIDADLKRSYGGPVEGVGAAYGWEGRQTGVGHMEIVESSPPSRVLIKLDFVKPFEAHNTAEFSLRAQGDATVVTWAMYGPSPYISKLIGLFVSMDRMVGKDFETGLKNMKSAAEKPAS
jgi:uncharacterized protein YndB with AHSA1/START domain